MNKRYTARYWCVTWNNKDAKWGEDDFGDPSEDDLIGMGAEYISGALEIGANGNEHFQMYMEFSDPVRYFSYRQTGVKPSCNPKPV